MGVFSEQIAKWATQTRKILDQDVRAIEISLFSAIVKATPVDTGRARGNWQCSVSRPVYEAIERLDPSGEQAIADIIANVGGAGKLTWLANNLPYIEVLEYGGYPNPPKHGTHVKGGGYEQRSEGGYSRQAPAGMVRINIARMQEIVREALAASGSIGGA